MHYKKLGFSDNLLIFYKKHISPVFKYMFSGGCRYLPTCSEYCVGSYKKFNLIKASFLCLKRVVKCNPWSPGGYDPVK